MFFLELKTFFFLVEYISKKRFIISKKALENVIAHEKRKKPN